MAAKKMPPKKLGVGAGVKGPVKFGTKTTVAGKIVSSVRQAAKGVGFSDGYRPTPKSFINALKEVGFDKGPSKSISKAAVRPPVKTYKKTTNSKKK